MSLRVRERRFSVKHQVVTIVAVFALLLQPVYMAVSGIVASAVAAPGSVLINEIAPTTGTTTEKWVELYNPGTASIDISNWRLTRNNTTISPVFGGELSIPGGGYYVYSTTNSFSPQSATLRLLDGSSGPIIDSIEYPLLSNGSAYARVTDGAAKWETRTGDQLTRGASNALVSVSPTPLPAPVVTLDGLTSGGYSNKRDVTIRWTQPSDDAVRYEYNYWNDIVGNQYKEATPSRLVTTNLYYSGSFTEGDGVHHMRARAFDAAGNASEWSNVFTVIYDATAPVITTNIADGQTLSGRQIVQLHTDGEQNPAIANIRLLTPDGRAVPSQGLYTQAATNQTTWDFNTTAVPDGVYRLQLSARDKASNAATVVMRTITIDNNGPIITIETPQHNQWLSNTSDADAIEVRGFVTDVSGVDRVEMYIEGDRDATLQSQVATADNSYRFVVPSESLRDGAHTIVVVAYDIHGYQSTQTRAVRVDNTGPSVVLSVAKDTYRASETIRINAVFTDHGSGVSGGVIMVFDVNQPIDDDAEPVLLCETESDAPSARLELACSGRLPAGAYGIVAVGYDALWNITSEADIEQAIREIIVLQDAGPAPSTSPSLGGAGNTGGALTPDNNQVQTSLIPQAAAVVAQAQGDAPAASDTQTVEGEVLAEQDEQTDTGVGSVSDETTEEATSGWLGLAWYWWLLIVAAIAGLFWWLLAAARRRRDDDTN